MRKRIIKEACVESFIELKSAITKGANRIELNDNMNDWGTTPSLGNIKKGIEYCRKHNIPIIVMNRPRGGNFYYSNEEKYIMLTDLEIMVDIGVSGVAVGALDKNNTLDKRFLEKFISQAKEEKIEVTFHRAFDKIPYEQQEESLSYLADLGVDRIATHGSWDSNDILDNVERLKKLNEVDNRLQVMAGGGVTKENFETLVALAELSEVHGTKIV